MHLDDYAAQDGLGLAALIAKGEVSAEEVTRAALEAGLPPATGPVSMLVHGRLCGQAGWLA
jgi:hypothetical protein